MTPSMRGSERRKRIQTLFLHPVEFYRLSEGARLLGITPYALKREAEQDRREDYRAGGTWRFTWRQLAYVAFRTWTLAEIQEALGPEAARVLPPLLALRSVTARLPEFLLRAMEIAAENDGTTLDAWLHFEMMDFASGVVERMETVLPGYSRAFHYPGVA